MVGNTVESLFSMMLGNKSPANALACKILAHLPKTVTCIELGHVSVTDTLISLFQDFVQLEKLIIRDCPGVLKSSNAFVQLSHPYLKELVLDSNYCLSMLSLNKLSFAKSKISRTIFLMYLGDEALEMIDCKELEILDISYDSKLDRPEIHSIKFPKLNTLIAVGVSWSVVKNIIRNTPTLKHVILSIEDTVCLSQYNQ